MRQWTVKKSLLVNLSISIVTIVLCLGGLELGARIWEHNLAKSSLGWELVASRRIKVEPSGNPRINAVLRPNMDYTWEGIPVHINSRGLRDAERNLAKRDGAYRILNLGDSVAFGWEVHARPHCICQFRTVNDATTTISRPQYSARDAKLPGSRARANVLNPSKPTKAGQKHGP